MLGSVLEAVGGFAVGVLVVLGVLFMLHAPGWLTRPQPCRVWVAV